MVDMCRLIWRMFTDLFRFEAEILVLRQQINVLRRGAPRKLAFNPIDARSGFRAGPFLSDTDQKFLLPHALFGTNPRAGTAMGEQRLK